MHLMQCENSFSESLKRRKKQSDLNARMEKTLPGEGLITGLKRTLTCFWMPTVGPNDSRHTEPIWPIAKRGQFFPDQAGHAHRARPLGQLRQIKYPRHLRGHRLSFFSYQEAIRRVETMRALARDYGYFLGGVWVGSIF